MIKIFTGFMPNFSEMTNSPFEVNLLSTIIEFGLRDFSDATIGAIPSVLEDFAADTSVGFAQSHRHSVFFVDKMSELRA